MRYRTIESCGNRKNPRLINSLALITISYNTNQPASLLILPTRKIRAAAGNDSKIITSSEDGTVKIWNLTQFTPKSINKFSSPSDISYEFNDYLSDSIHIVSSKIIVKNKRTTKTFYLNSGGKLNGTTFIEYKSGIYKSSSINSVYINKYKNCYTATSNFNEASISDLNDTSKSRNFINSSDWTNLFMFSFDKSLFSTINYPIKLVPYPQYNRILTISYNNGFAQLWDFKGNHIADLLIHLYSPNDLQKRLSRNSGLNQNDIFNYYNNYRIKSVNFSNEKQTINICHFDGHSREWGLNGNLINDTKLLPNIDLTCYDILIRNESTIFTYSIGEANGTLWNIDGSIQAKIEMDSLTKLNYAYFIPLEDRLITIGSNSIDIWKQNGQKVSTINSDKPIIQHVLSPDGNKIAFIEAFNGVSIWDLNNNLVVTLLKNRVINSVDFSNKGNHILTISNNYSITIWEAKGNILHDFLGTGKKISHVYYSPFTRPQKLISKTILMC